MQPAAFLIDKAMTCGVASKVFAGFQGSLLYKCSVISGSLRIKSTAIAWESLQILAPTPSSCYCVWVLG